MPPCKLMITLSNFVVLFFTALAIDYRVTFGELRQFFRLGLVTLYLCLSYPCLPYVCVYNWTESTNLAKSLSLSSEGFRTRIG